VVAQPTIAKETKNFSTLGKAEQINEQESVAEGAFFNQGSMIADY